MMKYIIILCLYLVVFVLSEILYRKFKASFLLSRKFAHIAGAIVSFLLPYFVSNIGAVYIGVIFTIIIYISKKGYLFKSIHDNKGLSIGEILFPLGIAISAFYIWPISILAFQGSCLVLGLSDGLAGYIGKKYGKKRYSIIFGDKTIEGSFVFFIITTLIFSTYFFCSKGVTFSGLPILFLCSLAITFFEALFSRGWDNLIIPITAGLALMLIIS